MPDTREFYVGYFPEAPEATGMMMKCIIYILAISTIVVAALIAWQQKKFATTNFENGLFTEVNGYLFSKPTPHLLVPLGRDFQNRPLYQTVLLVGFGKAGADKLIFSKRINWEKAEGSKVHLTGSLIYGDGKTLLQVDETSDLKYLEGDVIEPLPSGEKEKISLSGEIVDPKCYFGVMKPGEGKTHRSCAIRCLAGGIPPVLKTDSSGYFLLVDENKEPVSAEISNIVGDNVTLEGVQIHLNDWKLFQINSGVVHKLSADKALKDHINTFETGITYCK